MCGYEVQNATNVAILPIKVKLGFMYMLALKHVNSPYFVASL